jgi:hypothetical protein
MWMSNKSAPLAVVGVAALPLRDVVEHGTRMCSGVAAPCVRFELHVHD